MAVEVIDTALTQTYYADSGDEIIVAASGSVITSEQMGVHSRTGDQFGIDVTVHGTILADEVGICLANLSGSGEGYRDSVSIETGGKISAKLGVQVFNSYGGDVVNAGSVTGIYSGIQMHSPNSTFLNSGEVSGATYGAWFQSYDSHNPNEMYDVTNTGQFFHRKE